MMKGHKKRIGYYTTQIAGAEKGKRGVVSYRTLPSVADLLMKDGRKKMTETLTVREAEELKD